ncbi:MAG: HAD family phosphatase [Bacteroidales bacterium]|nr:HAD family phosphatase [Bacteroidales bacterium]
MPENTIDSIIFDFGGVIINIDHQKVENAFHELGINDFEQMFSKAVQSDLFQKFEKGMINSGTFRKMIKEITGLKLSDHELDFAWNHIIGDYPPERIELLKQIGDNYRLFLLSNTNQIHYDYYIHLFKQQFGFEFESLFEAVFWSFKVGKRKPDQEAYLHVFRECGLAPENTLFIDDTLINIIQARKTGLKAYYLMEHQDIIELFEDGKLSESILNSFE